MIVRQKDEIIGKCKWLVGKGLEDSWLDKGLRSTRLASILLPPEREGRVRSISGVTRLWIYRRDSDRACGGARWRGETRWVR